MLREFPQEQFFSESAAIICSECLFANILESNVALQRPGDNATGKNLNDVKLLLQEFFPWILRNPSVPPVSLFPEVNEACLREFMAFGIHWMKVLFLFMDIMSSGTNSSLFFYVSQLSFWANDANMCLLLTVTTKPHAKKTKETAAMFFMAFFLVNIICIELIHWAFCAITENISQCILCFPVNEDMSLQ